VVCGFHHQDRVFYAPGSGNGAIVAGQSRTQVAEDKVLVTGLKGPLEQGRQQKAEAFAARIPLQG